MRLFTNRAEPCAAFGDAWGNVPAPHIPPLDKAAHALAALTDAQFADAILARAEQMQPRPLMALGQTLERAGWARLEPEELG